MNAQRKKQRSPGGSPQPPRNNAGRNQPQPGPSYTEPDRYDDPNDSKNTGSGDQSGIETDMTDFKLDKAEIPPMFSDVILSNLDDITFEIIEGAESSEKIGGAVDIDDVNERTLALGNKNMQGEKGNFSGVRQGESLSPNEYDAYKKESGVRQGESLSPKEYNTVETESGLAGKDGVGQTARADNTGANGHDELEQHLDFLADPNNEGDSSDDEPVTTRFSKVRFID